MIATDDTFTQIDERGREVWEGKCLHCRRKLRIALDGEPISEATLEHIVPRNHGGTDDARNLGLACAGCNHEKGRRHDVKKSDDPRAAEIIKQLQAERDARWRFDPPSPPQTDRIALDVLGPHVVEIDYEAIMGSRERLRRELQWGNPESGRVWPPDDFTLEENREDLARHLGEFERREAFAYTVLDPARERCVGCIYIEPEGSPVETRLAFWVIDAELEHGLERHLLETVLGWIETSWPFERVIINLTEANTRARELCGSLHLRPHPDALPNHTAYTWTRWEIG